MKHSHSKHIKNGEISPRRLRVGEQIKHVLAQIMQEHKLLDPLIEDNIITISQVQMTADLKLANVYFTAFNCKDIPALQKCLNSHSKFYKLQATHALRQMKYMPEFRFFYDDSFDNYSRIDSLLRTPEVAQDLEPIDKLEE